MLKKEAYKTDQALNKIADIGDGFKKVGKKATLLFNSTDKAVR